MTVPLMLIGLGMGGLASQLGAVTVSAVPEEESSRGRRSAEHGHAVRCVARDGARRLDPDRGADGVVPERDLDRTPTCPRRSSSQANVELTEGVPFVSDDS